MKYKFFVILLIITGFMTKVNVYSDDNISNKTNGQNTQVQQPVAGEKTAITVGVMQGGGSLIGADLEFLVSKTVGLQIGAGFVGYGAGINFHFKPTVRSSFVCLGYWHQGIGDSYSQSMVGGTFVFRAKKIFTAQLGLGYRVGYSSLFEEKFPEIINAPLMALYSIGIYFPLD